LTNKKAKEMKQQTSLLVGFLLLIAGGAQAQDQSWREVTTENVAVRPRDAKTAFITFDIAWQASWRHDVNHDAVWVFFKARANDSTEWQHVRLAADRVLNPKGYSQAEGDLPATGERESRAATPLEFIVPRGDDGFTGVFVRQANYGRRRNIAAHGITAVWDLTAARGIREPTPETVEIRAFGVIMVYIPEGPFYLGSGGTEAHGFYMYTDGGQDFPPYHVTSAGAIPTGQQPGRLWASSARPFIESDSQPPDGGEIPAAFPNGYTAFYCMKSEITFRQYADFLNTLPPEEAEKRFCEQVGSRSGEAPRFTYLPKIIDKSGPRGFSWADGAAWAAWAGLRPITELEYEKSMRGPRKPLPGETGPPYWGVRSSNTWDWFSYHPAWLCERPVTIANAEGRRFRGTHGLGTTVLPEDWPQDDAVGTGYRAGMGRIMKLRCTRIADRSYTALTNPERHDRDKWRGARTAPEEAGP
jgi:hypothetical protein